MRLLNSVARIERSEIRVELSPSIMGDPGLSCETGQEFHFTEQRQEPSPFVPISKAKSPPKGV
jgi:hypothetical protein